MTTADVTELALGVVRGLLRGDELESFEVGPKPPPEDRYPFETESDLWLHLSVAGEWFDLPMTGDSSTEHLTLRLESNLQDWIAESKFAWGELRVRNKPEAAIVGAPTTNLENNDGASNELC